MRATLCGEDLNVIASDVISNDRRWSIERSDCLPWLQSLPADSVDLVMTSPPYELARTYLERGKNLGIARKTEEWVAWMVEVIGECSRVCRGLVALVVEG
jgi:DNA modification methylase